MIGTFETQTRNVNILMQDFETKNKPKKPKTKY